MHAEKFTRRMLEDALEARNEKDAFDSVLALVQKRDRVWSNLLLAEKSLLSAAGQPARSTRYSRDRFYQVLDRRRSDRDRLAKELGVQ